MDKENPSKLSRIKKDFKEYWPLIPIAALFVWAGVGVNNFISKYGPIREPVLPTSTPDYGATLSSIDARLRAVETGEASFIKTPTPTPGK